MRKRMLLILSAAVLLFCSIEVFAEAQPKNILIVLSNTSAKYTSVSNQFQLTLQTLADRQIAIEQLPVEEFESRQLQEPQIDLIVSVGARAFKQVANTELNVPLVATLIPKQTYQRIVEQTAKKNHPLIAAIYLDQPLNRQLEFGRQLLPAASNVGILLSSYTLSLKQSLVEAAAPLNFRVVEANIDEQNERTALKTILRDSDFILSVPDPVVHTPTRAKWLLYSAYQKQIPIIAFSKSYVTAGALGSIYSTPEQIGRQAAEKVYAILTQTENAFRDEYPKYFDVAVNHTVAASLRLVVPGEREILQRLQNLKSVKNYVVEHKQTAVENE